MIRFLLAVFAGLALSFVGVIAVEVFSAEVHPLPADFPAADEHEAFQQAMCAHVENYPAWVLAVAAVMWLAIIYAGVRTAAWISGRVAGLTVAGLLLLALACDLWMLPYPVWFEVVMLVGLPVVSWIAVRSRGQSEGAAPEAATPEAE